ncbi:helix-turn-helix domain containing protein [Nocardioides sp. CER19]|uniref:TetR/AcrR family transcriptional regulator n=1 Tax=Nocardioides sp. CER19 TaxID=3038538 RepID=UPI002447263C|nr:helix-turn-helix domain containing protein [Nocardioides sp. CER19]MDH2414548.1 helix-turn-helix domain containing protein [Nocardioides sp. CER19]
MEARRERARPLTPDERREALVSATLPLLYQHGRAVTTKLIAEAAGVAEGTIFRVFDSKEQLVDAAMAKAFEPGQIADRIAEIDPAEPLREKLLKITSILQQRFRATFGLMRAMGEMGPPRHKHVHPERRHDEMRAVRESMAALLEPDAARLSVEPAMLVHMLRLLTFAGSNEQIADGQVLTPDQIVDTLLHGTLRKD